MEHLPGAARAALVGRLVARFQAPADRRSNAARASGPWGSTGGVSFDAGMVLGVEATHPGEDSEVQTRGGRPELGRFIRLG